jgi:hypothetical protein
MPPYATHQSHSCWKKKSPTGHHFVWWNSLQCLFKK